MLTQTTFLTKQTLLNRVQTFLEQVYSRENKMLLFFWRSEATLVEERKGGGRLTSK